MCAVFRKRVEHGRKKGSLSLAVSVWEGSSETLFSLLFLYGFFQVKDVPALVMLCCLSRATSPSSLNMVKTKNKTKAWWRDVKMYRRAVESEVQKDGRTRLQRFLLWKGRLVTEPENSRQNQRMGNKGDEFFFYVSRKKMMRHGLSIVQELPGLP